MRVLPIVEREMRVAARQPRTWWRRVWVTGVGLAIFGFVLLEAGQWTTASRLGSEIFSALGALGMVYALLGGPMATVDCLSRERREGTLGLLFLTELRSRDVVAGKMVSASLDTLLALAAAMPVVILPLLLGGVSLLQFGCVLLALINILVLSLSAGACASAFLDSGRAALGATLAFMVFLTLAPLILAESYFHISMASKSAVWFYLCCPLYVMTYCFDSLSRTTLWRYWLAMGGLHALSWGLLALATFRTSTAWRGSSAPVLGSRWRQRLQFWSQGSRRARSEWRRQLLARNPVRWLEMRDRFQTAMLWFGLAASWAFWVAQAIRDPQGWPNQGMLVVWAMFTQYVFCIWIAIQSPRRLADDKQSGALELLLCTPIQPREIVRGAMQALWRRFGWTFLAIVGFDVLAAFSYFQNHPGWGGFVGKELAYLIACGASVFPLQAYSMARIGLYQGLRQGNSLRASFSLLWKVGLLPWVLFLATLLSYEYLRRFSRGLPNISDALGYGTWIGAHVLSCLFFLARAELQLRCRLRELAAQTGQRSWWQAVFAGVLPG